MEDLQSVWICISGAMTARISAMLTIIGTAAPERRTSMRPIDGDLLMKTVFNDVVLVDGEVKGVGLILAETVDKAPTIDAVPVVRCKDCRHMEKSQYGRYCQIWRMYNGHGDDGFCCYGERKECAD